MFLIILILAAILLGYVLAFAYLIGLSALKPVLDRMVVRPQSAKVSLPETTQVTALEVAATAETTVPGQTGTTVNTDPILTEHPHYEIMNTGFELVQIPESVDIIPQLQDWALGIPFTEPIAQEHYWKALSSVHPLAHSIQPEYKIKGSPFSVPTIYTLAPSPELTPAALATEWVTAKQSACRRLNYLYQPPLEPMRDQDSLPPSAQPDETVSALVNLIHYAARKGIIHALMPRPDEISDVMAKSKGPDAIFMYCIDAFSDSGFDDLEEQLLGVHKSSIARWNQSAHAGPSHRPVELQQLFWGSHEIVRR